jgi:hypothetical protein
MCFFFNVVSKWLGKSEDSLGKAEIAEPKSNLQRSGSLYWPEAKHSGFLV